MGIVDLSRLHQCLMQNKRTPENSGTSKSPETPVQFRTRSSLHHNNAFHAQSNFMVGACHKRHEESSQLARPEPARVRIGWNDRSALHRTKVSVRL